jgi:hypothetical protein
MISGLRFARAKPYHAGRFVHEPYARYLTPPDRCSKTPAIEVMRTFGCRAGTGALDPKRKTPSPFQGHAKKCSFQPELPTGRAEVLSITGSAGAHGGQASQYFSPNPRECASALVISRKTMKGWLA